MIENPFTAVLTEELQHTDGMMEGLDTLQKFCRAVEESTGSRVACALERGHVLSVGQEWFPVLRAGGYGPRVLFRAYVPSEGWPVSLDFESGSLVRCANQKQLVDELQSFLRASGVVSLIRTMMALPATPSPPADAAADEE
jgi:hypothetical protein